MFLAIKNRTQKPNLLPKKIVQIIQLKRIIQTKHEILKIRIEENNHFCFRVTAIKTKIRFTSLLLKK